jgi:perosamine synthetase
MLADEVVRRIRSVHPNAGPLALHEPVFVGNEVAYVRDAIESGWVSSAGSRIEDFENGLMRVTGSLHAIAIVNGTAALHLSLVASGVQPGDEVLVPALCFVAAANAVSYCGAQPHWVDCDRDNLGVDAPKLRNYLEGFRRERGGLVNPDSGRVIRALIVVHNFGHPASIDALAELCEAFGITLIEDAAESLGSTYLGRPTGSFGRLSTLSFNGNKTITTGGGGAILTDEHELASRVRHLSSTARSAERWAWSHDAIGYNYRMPALNAALGCAQLEVLPRLLESKRELARAYFSAFDDLDGASLFLEPENARSNYWLNLLVIDRDRIAEREAILRSAQAAQIQLRPIWTPLHRLPMYKDHPRMDLSQTEDLAERVIALPSTPRLAGDPAKV